MSGEEMTVLEMLATDVDQRGRVPGYVVETRLAHIESVIQHSHEPFVRIVVDPGGPVNFEIRILAKDFRTYAEGLK